MTCWDCKHRGGPCKAVYSIAVDVTLCQKRPFYDAVLEWVVSGKDPKREAVLESWAMSLYEKALKGWI